MKKLKISFRKGENIDELIRYNLSSLLNFNQDNYYYTCRQTAGYLDVKYAEEKELGTVLRDIDTKKSLRMKILILLSILTILFISNLIVIRIRKFSFRSYCKARLIEINHQYHNHLILVKRKERKLKNSEFVDFLHELIQLPVNIENIIIIENSYSAKVFVEEQPTVILMKRLSSLGSTREIQYAMQNNITYLYIRGLM